MLCQQVSKTAGKGKVVLGLVDVGRQAPAIQVNHPQVEEGVCMTLQVSILNVVCCLLCRCRKNAP